MLRTLLITELKGRIHRPFLVIHQLITFPRHRERHREFLAERLLHAGIKIIRFLLDMRIDRIIRRFSIQSMVGLPALLVGEGEVEAVIQSPPSAEGVFLSDIDLPAVDFLPIVHAETLRRSVRIRPAIILHRRALIIGIIQSDVQSEARRVVCRDVVHLIFGGFEVFRLRKSSPRAVQGLPMPHEGCGIGELEIVPLVGLVIQADAKVVHRPLLITPVVLVDFVARTGGKRVQSLQIHVVGIRFRIAR